MKTLMLNNLEVLIDVVRDRLNLYLDLMGQHITGSVGQVDDITLDLIEDVRFNIDGLSKIYGQFVKGDVDLSTELTDILYRNFEEMLDVMDDESLDINNHTSLKIVWVLRLVTSAMRMHGVSIK